MAEKTNLDENKEKEGEGVSIILTKHLQGFLKY